jgi:hypothetical protein
MKWRILCLLAFLLGLFTPRPAAVAAPAKPTSVQLLLVSQPNYTYNSRVTVLQYLEQANTKRGNAGRPVSEDLPNELQIAIGSPVNAIGVSRIGLEGPSIPEGKQTFIPTRTVIVRGKPVQKALDREAGVAVIMKGFYFLGGRLYASVYKWAGSIPYASTRPNGSSGAAAVDALKKARAETAPYVNIDVTNVMVAMSSTSRDADGSNIEGPDGMATLRIHAFWGATPPPPPPPVPTGSLALSKPVQRSGTTILVTPSAQLFNTLSVQRRTGVAPPYSPGQNIGPTKPSFGTEVATVNGTGVAQTADVPDAVVYYALFALGGDNNWYFLDSKTLTPYGYVAGFDVLSLDTMSTMALTGLSRRTRADKTYRIELDTVGGSQILTRLPRDPAHDAADHEMELWATGFSAPNTALANQGFQPGGPVFNAAPPGSILKGRHNFLLGQPAISLGGLQRPPETPYALDIVPWSRPVRSATGWVPGVQLSSPVRLTVYPVAGFELVSGIIDLRRGVCRNRGTQGQDIALPGPDVELDVSVTMRVLRPYPHSRVILVAQDPNGALLKVAEVDNRMSPSDAPFEMSFGTVTPFFDTTGNYTFYLMAETPVDQATLGGAGLPGYSEPTTPGYGWVKIGTVTFFYDAVIEYHDVTSVEGGQNLVPQ